MKRILLVDDHEIVRNGLKLLIETFNDYEVVGDVSNGAEALEFLEECEVDLILLDLNMPVMDGLEFLEQYHHYKLSIPVVILTTMKDHDKIKKGIHLGAKSYLLKDSSRDILYRSLQAAINSEMLLTQEIYEKLSVAGFKDILTMEIEDFGLTDKEKEILKIVANGDTNKSIAVDMGIAERTVKAHLTSIYTKMGVASRSEAVGKAIANKLIEM